MKNETISLTATTVLLCAFWSDRWMGTSWGLIRSWAETATVAELLLYGSLIRQIAFRGACRDFISSHFIYIYIHILQRFKWFKLYLFCWISQDITRSSTQRWGAATSRTWVTLVFIAGWKWCNDQHGVWILKRSRDCHGHRICRGVPVTCRPWTPSRCGIRSKKGGPGMTFPRKQSALYSTSNRDQEGQHNYTIQPLSVA